MKPARQSPVSHLHYVLDNTGLTAAFNSIAGVVAHPVLEMVPWNDIPEYRSADPATLARGGSGCFCQTER